jgi:hypothetical protein
MSKQSLIRRALIIFYLPLGIISGCCNKQSEKEIVNNNNVNFLITDTNMISVLDTYIEKYNLDSNTLLRLYIENIPWRKSFIIVNSYSADDLKFNSCSYYSLYKGFNILIYTGIEKFKNGTDSIPQALNKFMNKEPKVYNYFSHRYEFNYETKKDTFYQIDVNLYLFNPEPKTDYKFLNAE